MHNIAQLSSWDLCPAQAPDAFVQRGFVRRCVRLVLALQRNVHLHQLTRLLCSCWRFEIAQEFHGGAVGHSGLGGCLGYLSPSKKNQTGMIYDPEEMVIALTKWGIHSTSLELVFGRIVGL